MDVATFAFIIGVYEILIGVPMLVAPRDTFRWIIHGQQNHDVLVRAVAALFLIMAALVLWRGAAITASVDGVIRLLAWVTVIKCLGLCWFAPLMLRVRRPFVNLSPITQRVMSVFVIALGVYLLWASCHLGGCCQNGA
ncbi:MAG: hypothetical protein DWQ31_19925 [Planctomycetota bacterium]|nr:MAG: hypothetical protein DWQ31_19925 [Planctomycetota bacterium]REJ94030.1 MAG: hypothetical protein DWQ35_09115 [Planctomycetota bacterium]REK17870.1 MAG: hypothetical protein DWQ42_21400 [Planctomycetota bacterium]REK42411.1 MAG: hypothetical protein DWQ46_13550 [Planctomycetota bacterium]